MVVILCLDTLLIMRDLRTIMKQQALRTAMTLYENDTLDLQTAANQAGVPAERLRLAVRRASGSIPTVTPETDRVSLRAN